MRNVEYIGYTIVESRVSSVAHTVGQGLETLDPEVRSQAMISGNIAPSPPLLIAISYNLPLSSDAARYARDQWIISQHLR
jgi:hypothetical protein